MPDTDPASAPVQAHGARLFEPPPSVPALAALAWCPLDERALLRVEGADAESFLQGQLTQDVARLAADQALYAAHCSAKGRITALFLAWRDGPGFLLDLPASLGEPARRRLAMYLLRAKATIQDAASAWERTALCGSEAATVLAAAGFSMPAASGALARHAGMSCLRLGEQRWLVVAPRAGDGGLRTRLGGLATADPAGWQLACLRDGVPEVQAETADSFIPQMLNLDRLDGISFRKGCYTGQEIVARAHYLGRVKRRMRRFGYTGATVPAPGMQLPLGASADAAADEAGAAQAQVVWALATGPAGGEVLAVAVSSEPETDGAQSGPGREAPQ